LSWFLFFPQKKIVYFFYEENNSRARRSWEDRCTMQVSFY